MKKIFTLFAALAWIVSMFAATETVYFVNAEDWPGEITVHAWEGAAPGTNWPGLSATKEAEKIGGKDVWSFTAEAGAYAKCIFTNKKTGDKQTGNLNWTAGKYYVKTKWYTKEEAATAVGIPTPTYDYYVAGSFNGWVNPDPSCGMALVGDVYKTTLSLDAGEHQMKVTNGTWDNAKGYDAVGAKYEEVSRAPGDDGNILVKLAAGKEVVVVYNKNTDKITFEGLTATGETPETPAGYYVTGTFNNWTNPDNAYAMTGEGNIYKKDLTLAAGAHMLKVTNGTWDDGCNWGYSNIAGAYSEVSEGTNDEGEANGNILITLAAEATVTVVFDAEAKKISFEGLTATGTTPETPAGYYVTGTFNNWTNPDNAYAMTGEGNIYKKDLTLAAGAHMLKVTNGTWDDGCNWGFWAVSAAYAEVTEGTNDEGQPNGNILITLAAEATVTVVFDAEAKKISFEGLTAQELTISYVLMGVGGDWKVGVPMTKNEKAEGEEYMLIGQTITASDSVKVVKLVNGEAKHYCGNVKDDCKELVLENKVNDNIVLAPGVYDFYYDVAADAIWIAVSSSDPSAVGNVIVEKKAVKVIRNGQMYILRDGVMYNAIGQIAE